MDNNRTYIIAEAGVNHNGNMDDAFRLIDIASEAGSDAVKFQTFKADDLVIQGTLKAPYQQLNTDANESQYDMLKRLEISDKSHKDLMEYCRQKKIDFLSTPFDVNGIEFLTKGLGLTTIKMGSGDVTNGPYLLKGAICADHIILSTGMCDLAEIEQALAVILWGVHFSSVAPPSLAPMLNYAKEQGFSSLKKKVTLLHCVSEYPVPMDAIHLRAMGALHDKFGLDIGYSDHSIGIDAAVLAVAMGAKIIEKHFTISRDRKGPDHAASLEPLELHEMVKKIRNAEIIMGKAVKEVSEGEKINRPISRKSLVAKQDIPVSTIFTVDNITSMRPATGVSPMQYWDFLGKSAKRNIKKDEQI